MNDERLVEALRALAEHDSACEAPVRVEARLLEALRVRRRKRVVWRTAIAAAVLVAMLVGAAQWRRPHPKVSTPQLGTAVAVQMPKTPQPVLPPQRDPRPEITQVATPQEVDTPFFPLLDAPPPFERGELVRVTVPASAMRVVGLPVREERLEDPVLADVLIGEEGMARAIRFVSFEQQ
jgi:hypothetical protein